MFQHSDSAQYIVSWKSADSHKVPLIQSFALSDISLLTACHSYQFPLNNSNKYS